MGRLGGTDFGFLNMQTAPHGDLSSENMGVLRLRQQLFNPYSNAGGMLTTRMGSHGKGNVAYGLDAALRLFGDEYLLLQWAQTFDEAIEEAAGALESGLVRARWERRRDEGFSYHAEASRVGSDYHPGLGFQTRRGLAYGTARLRYRQFREADSSLRSRGAEPEDIALLPECRPDGRITGAGSRAGARVQKRGAHDSGCHFELRKRARTV